MDTGISTLSQERYGGEMTKNRASFRMPHDNMRITTMFEDLSERARSDLFAFLGEIGLVSEDDILVIPAMRHYFYDADDLKKVRAIINLKQLNHVKDIREFLRAVAELMPQKSSLVGCFVDNQASNGFSDKYINLPGEYSEKAEAYENGIESRIPFINRMYSFIDARTNRYLTRRSVSNLLKEYGLSIVNMTELNGLTYFYSEKTISAA